ncbi:hypothetical protein AIIKEEIJ_02760 [Rhodococcus sp. YH1]|nr:hypothetical protein [Rhodococcus sp. YH1]
MRHGLQEEGDGGAGQGQAQRPGAATAEGGQPEDHDAGGEGPGEGEPQVLGGGGHAQQVDREHHQERGARVEAEQSRVGQRIAGVALDEGAGDAECDADHESEDRARDPQGVHDDVGVGAVVDGQRVDDLGDGHRSRADGDPGEQHHPQDAADGEQAEEPATAERREARVGGAGGEARGGGDTVGDDLGAAPQQAAPRAGRAAVRGVARDQAGPLLAEAAPGAALAVPAVPPLQADGGGQCGAPEDDPVGLPAPVGVGECLHEQHADAGGNGEQGQVEGLGDEASGQGGRYSGGGRCVRGAEGGHRGGLLGGRELGRTEVRLPNPIFRVASAGP